MKNVFLFSLLFVFFVPVQALAGQKESGEQFYKELKELADNCPADSEWTDCRRFYVDLEQFYKELADNCPTYGEEWKETDCRRFYVDEERMGRKAAEQYSRREKAARAMIQARKTKRELDIEGQLKELRRLNKKFAYFEGRSDHRIFPYDYAGWHYDPGTEKPYCILRCGLATEIHVYLRGRDTILNSADVFVPICNDPLFTSAYLYSTCNEKLRKDCPENPDNIDCRRFNLFPPEGDNTFEQRTRVFGHCSEDRDDESCFITHYTDGTKIE